jgi:hypothetical protein
MSSLPPSAARIPSSGTGTVPVGGTRYANQDMTASPLDIATYFSRHQPPTHIDDSMARDWWIASFGQNAVPASQVCFLICRPHSLRYSLLACLLLISVIIAICNSIMLLISNLCTRNHL